MLQGQMTNQGNRLYLWRGFLPLLLTPVVVFGFWNFQHTQNSHRYDFIWGGICLSLAFLGLAIRFVVMGYTPRGSSYVGRSTKSPEEKKFKTTGVYSLCRHPLYLGNFFMTLGILLYLNSATVIAIYLLLFIFYYERLIMSEENFLSGEFGEAYITWAERTSLIIPQFSRWEKPERLFMWRVAVRREYKRIFGVIAIMTLFDILSNIIVVGELKLDLEWGILFVAGAIFYMTIRIMKKYKLLPV
jgi:protein-S-isoprenylcysteine O-methyltransferase Ste14